MHGCDDDGPGGGLSTAAVKDQREQLQVELPELPRQDSGQSTCTTTTSVSCSSSSSNDSSDVDSYSHGHVHGHFQRWAGSGSRRPSSAASSVWSECCSKEDMATPIAEQPLAPYMYAGYGQTSTAREPGTGSCSSSIEELDSDKTDLARHVRDMSMNSQATVRRASAAAAAAPAPNMPAPATASDGFPWWAGRIPSGFGMSYASNDQEDEHDYGRDATPSAIFGGDECSPSPGDELDPEHSLSHHHQGSSSSFCGISRLSSSNFTSSPSQKPKTTQSHAVNKPPATEVSASTPTNSVQHSSSANQPLDSASLASSSKPTRSPDWSKARSRSYSGTGTASNSRDNTPVASDAQSSKDPQLSAYMLEMRQRHLSTDSGRPPSGLTSSSSQSYDSSGKSNSLYSQYARSAISTNLSIQSDRPWVKDTDTASIKSNKTGSSSEDSAGLGDDADRLNVLSPAAPCRIPFLPTGPEPSDCSLNVDASSPDHFSVIITLPGFSFENITLALKRNGSLHILADRYDDGSRKNASAKMTAGHYERMVDLGEAAIGQKVQAVFDGKKLKVTVQKRQKNIRTSPNHYILSSSRFA